MEDQNKINEGLFGQETTDYRSVFDTANDGIFVHDIETGQIMDVNKKACEMFLYSKEEMLNLDVGAISSGEEPYTQKEAVRQIHKSAKGEALLFEWLCKDKAGRLFWVEVNLKSAIIGGRYRLLAIVRDVTERKQTEGRLARISDVFLHFGADPVDNIRQLTALCGELLSAECALYNHLEGELLHSCGQWNIPPDFSPLDRADGHICFDVIRKDSDEVTIVRNLQETKYAETDPNVKLYNLKTYIGCAVKFGGRNVGSLCAIYKQDFNPTDEDKRIIGIVAAAIGVEEERRHAEETNRMANFSLQHAGEAIYWAGSDAKILNVNETTCRVLGYSREELLGMTIHDIDPIYQKKTWSDHWKKIREEGAFTFESKHRKKDGTIFPVEVTVNYLKFQDKEFNCAFARDISDRKKQEIALLKRDEQLEILSRTSQHINSILEVPSILRTLVAAAIELVGAQGGMAGLLVDGKVRFTEYNKNGKIQHINIALDSNEELPGCVVKSKKPYLCNNMKEESQVPPGLKKAFGIYSLISVPIVNGKGDLVGCFEVFNKENHETFDAQDVFMLQGLAASAAVALENAKMLIERKNAERERKLLNEELLKTNEKLKQIALKDHQTGLYNHRYLSEILESEFSRAKRYGHTLSAIMIDIDYFKSINDTYGHKFGDLVIKQLASHLKRMVRRYDVVVRFGGEEFVILSPGTDRTGALSLAQRILDAINLYNFGDKKRMVRLKLSMAVTSYPEDRITRGIDLINSADKILDKAKANGGNDVYTYSDMGRDKEKRAAVKREIEPTDIRFLREKIEKLTKKGKQNLIESIFAFAKTIELKDHYTGEHVESTVHYATEIANALKLSSEEIDNIRQAAVLHDLGKIGISDKILRKKSKLTKKEFDEIKKHPQIAADIIRPVQFMHDIVPLILYHHERWDGKGYPAGLKQEDIPIGARIISVADVYQALTSNRPYRKARSKTAAIKILKKGWGTQFDPHVVDAFLKILKKEK